MAIRRIEQALLQLGFINEDQLEMVREEQEHRPGESIGKIAEEMDFISDDQLAEALAMQMDMPVMKLSEVEIPPEVIDHVSEPMAQLYKIIPVQFDNNVLTIAMGDPENLSVQDELRTFLGYEIHGVVASQGDVRRALDRYYATSTESIESIVGDLEADNELARAADAVSGDGTIDLTSVEALADSAAVRRLLNMVLLMAIKEHASDVHFEPFEDEFHIRIKADGVLYELVPPPRHLAFAITTRLKVMANLDIAERRLPQDGRIELTVGGHRVDLRMSVLPTMFGESVVLRVLDRSVVELDMNKLGMDKHTISEFRKIMTKPNGIVLVTGPTGSGKTTTLYSAMSELNTIEDKLITTEDPVEYDLDGIVQIPIDAEIGNTFAHCLRSILRQDPDKILVGEIRDVETAEIAVQASLTGHLVFSTLHTNDAPSSITRLRDMGIPQFLITATVEAILAQRLVRRICSQCREPMTPTEDLLTLLDLTPEDVADKTFYRGKGCEVCNNTGYKGRAGLYELMIMTNQLRDMIINNATTDELREEARTNGMVTLREYGIDFCYDGTTTIDEIVRETIVDA